MGFIALLPLIIGALGALACLIAAFRALRRKRLIDDVPTSKTQGVFIGLAELKGTAESEIPFLSFLAGVRCVLYEWRVEEQWRRTVTTTSTDAQGHVHTSTHTETGWTKVDSGGESLPFYLKDDAGVIRIDPEGASITPETVFDRTVTPLDDLYYGKGPPGAIANTTMHRRFRETALPLHAAIYVMGQARERSDAVAAEIALDKSAPLFLISIKTERQISAGYARWLWVFLAVGLVVAAGGVLTTGAIGASRLDWSLLLPSAGGYLIAALIGWLWTVYNSLVNLHHMVEQGWSQVDVQLKRRSDLIPNLVAAVQGYAGHERATQELLASLRSQQEATPPGAAGPDFHGLAPSLRAVVEAYPDLKANESFLKLQRSLVETEQRIALARDYYNEAATFYNTRLEIVPDRFVAALGRLKPNRLLVATDFERAPVTVKLAD